MRRLATAETIIGMAALAVLVWWSAKEGGFEPVVWYPGGMFLLGLLGASALALGRLTRRPGLTGAAWVACALFAAWCYVSILWAGVEGDALEGANRTLVYVATFGVFAVPAWKAGGGALVLGLFSTGVAVVGLAELIATADLISPDLAFLDGRFLPPTGYHNATAALFLFAFWPAAALSSRRELNPFARGALMAVAGVLLELAILPQSRGAAIALAVAALVYVIAMPRRLRAVLWLIPTVIAAALAAGPLLEVYDALQAGTGAEEAVDGALRSVLISLVALLCIGSALAFVDRRIEIGARAVRIASRATGAVAAAVAVAAVAIALASVGNPATWAGDRWQDFKGGYEATGFETSRFTGSLGSDRYDFWRVSMAEFADAPVRGMGMDNFAAEYLLDRDSQEEPRHPHSLPVKILSQTGVVGAFLFGTFLLLAIAAAVRRRRAALTDLGATVSAAGLTGFAYFAVHASADWLWTFPALAAAAFAWLAIAGRVEAGDAPTRATALPRPARAAVTAAGGVALVAALAILAVSYLSVAETQRATSEWRDDTEGALDRLDRAAELNPLTDRPAMLAGAISIESDDLDGAGEHFAAAIERNPSNWYAALQLGAIASVRGDWREAKVRMRTALRLNPSDPEIADWLTRVHSHTAVRPRSIVGVLGERVCERIGRTFATPRCQGSDTPQNASRTPPPKVASKLQAMERNPWPGRG